MQFPGDIEYDQITSGNDFIGLQEKLKTPFVKTLAGNFEDGYRRVVHMHGLPLHVAYWSSALAHADCDPAVIEKLKTRAPPGNFVEACQRAAFALKEGGFVRGKEGDNPLSYGKGFMKYMQYSMASAPYEDNFIIQGIESVFFAMLSTAYSAFEAMASDLWVEAINQDWQLAERFLKKSPDKQIAASTLAGYQFDLRRSMGKILKEQLKVSFISLNSISKAYVDVFGDQVDAIFKSNGDVFLAEKIRHLIAHRGGTVDQKFADEANGAPSLTNVTVGKHLSLTGPLVSRFVDSCIHTGIQLLLFVDDKIPLIKSE